MTQEEIRQIADAVSVEIASRREMTFLESIEIIRIQAILEGMKAENKSREMNGCALCYGEAAFAKFSTEIQQIQNQYIDGLRKQAKLSRRRG